MNDPVEQVGIDPIDRLTILAAALPGAVVRQRRVAASFEAVWRVIEDLENATSRYEPAVARVHITSRDGERMQLQVEYAGGWAEPVAARLRNGWCLMQSATGIIAFAARPLGRETVLAHLEHQRAGAQIPGQDRPPHRRAVQAKIDRELATIERLAVQDKRRARRRSGRQC